MEQTELFKFVIQVLERLQIPYTVVGVFASSVWGESRFTQDIDILIDVSPADVSALCSAFPNDQFYVSQSAANEAAVNRTQFNVIHPSSGNPIDFMIASDRPWVRAQLDRRKRIQFFSDQSGAVATPEDVILGKLVYHQEGGSDKHLRDIAGILKFAGKDLDLDYLFRLSTRLGVTEVWQRILSKNHST